MTWICHYMTLCLHLSCRALYCILYGRPHAGPSILLYFLASVPPHNPRGRGPSCPFMPRYLKLPCCSITLHPTNPRSNIHPHTSPREKCLFRLSIRLSQHLRPRAVEIPRSATLSQEYPKIHLQTPVFVFIVMQPPPPPCCIILY